MRKIIAFTALLISAGTALWLFLHYSYVPKKMQEALITAIQDYGFTNAKATRITVEPGDITIYKLALDEDEFATIGEIKLTYRTHQYLFKNEIDKITIQSPELSIDLDSHGRPAITGLNGDIPQTPFQNLTRIRVIKVLDGKLDLFHNALGSLRFDFNGESHVSASGKHEPQFKIRTAQKRLNAHIDLRGHIESNGAWTLSFEIDNAGLETDNHAFNRITATLQTAGTGPANHYTSSELNIGSMRLYNTLWQNLSGTLEIQNDTTSFLLAGQNAKNENLEVTLAYSSLTPSIIRYSLYGKTLADLENFAIAQDRLAPLNLPDKIKLTPEVTAHINWPLSQEKAPSEELMFELNSYKYGIDLKGIIKDKKNITATLNASPVNSLPITNTKLVSAGVLTAKLTYNDGKLAPIGLALDGASLDLPPIKLDNIQFADATLDHQKSKTSIENVHFTLPLTPNIDQNATLDLNLRDGTIEALKNISVEVFGGTLSVQSLDPHEAPLSGIIEMKNIDLAEFSSAMPYNGLTLEGTLNGTIPFEMDGNTIKLKKARLKSNGLGKLGIHQGWVMHLFDDDSANAETTRQALENYNFKSLSITIDGIVSQASQITVDLDGHNPDMFEGRNIKMTLELNKNLRTFFRPIIVPITETTDTDMMDTDMMDMDMDVMEMDMDAKTDTDETL